MKPTHPPTQSTLATLAFFSRSPKALLHHQVFAPAVPFCRMFFLPCLPGNSNPSLLSLKVTSSGKLCFFINLPLLTHHWPLSFADSFTILYFIIAIKYSFNVFFQPYTASPMKVWLCLIYCCFLGAKYRAGNKQSKGIDFHNGLLHKVMRISLSRAKSWLYQQYIL